MQNTIIITVILAVAAAAPAVFIEDHDYPSKFIQTSQQGYGSYLHTPDYPVFHELSSAKSTLTKSSQVVNHGGTAVVHAPVYTHVHEHVPVVHELSSAKSTLTKSSQVVNHGGTAVLHAPVMTYSHIPVVHELGSAKSTLTRSSQVVNHGGTAVVHAPIYSHVMHHVYDYAPQTLVYAPQVYSSAKTGDSAISHHSSTVHETEHYPLYALHH